MLNTCAFLYVFELSAPPIGHIFRKIAVAQILSTYAQIKKVDIYEFDVDEPWKETPRAQGCMWLFINGTTILKWNSPPTEVEMRRLFAWQAFRGAMA